MLQVAELVVVRDEHRVLDGVSLVVQPGERVAVHGPSGCGKTTLLHAIAGLVRIKTGSIRLGPHDITHTRPHRRGVGLVFQDDQLFAHLDVANNVSYALRVRGAPQRERVAVAEEWLGRVGLSGFQHRHTASLSGGEAKRVALARTLAGGPNIVLLDEPLSGLDDELHDQLLGDLRDLFDHFGTTVVHVTHDRAEGTALCHRSVEFATLSEKVVTRQT